MGASITYENEEDLDEHELGESAQHYLHPNKEFSAGLMIGEIPKPKKQPESAFNNVFYPQQPHDYIDTQQE